MLNISYDFKHCFVKKLKIFEIRNDKLTQTITYIKIHLVNFSLSVILFTLTM